MELSQYLEIQLANWIKGTTMPAAPGALTLALSISDPTDTGAGISEPVGGSYARQTITFDAPAVTGGGVQIASTDAIAFPTATGNWGTITHIAVFEGSNMLFFGTLAAPKLINDGDSFSLAANNVQHTFAPQFSTYLGTELGNWIRGTTMDAAPTAKVALSTTDPLVSGTGLDEPPGTDGYAQQAITFGALSSVTGVGTTIANDGAIIFGPANTNPWPTVTHAAIMSGTDLLVFGPLAVSRSAEIGDAIPLAVGAVSLLIR